MRLGLYFFGHPKGSDAVWYNVGIQNEEGIIRLPTTEERQKIESLAPRIEAMASKVLGNSFKRIYINKTNGEIELCFKKGISSGSQKFDFRSFCGWTELCGLE